MRTGIGSWAPYVFVWTAQRIGYSGARREPRCTRRKLTAAFASCPKPVMRLSISRAYSSQLQQLRRDDRCHRSAGYLSGLYGCLREIERESVDHSVCCPIQYVASCTLYNVTGVGWRMRLEPDAHETAVPRPAARMDRLAGRVLPFLHQVRQIERTLQQVFAESVSPCVRHVYPCLITDILRAFGGMRTNASILYCSKSYHARMAFCGIRLIARSGSPENAATETKLEMLFRRGTEHESGGVRLIASAAQRFRNLAYAFEVSELHAVVALHASSSPSLRQIGDNPTALNPSVSLSHRARRLATSEID